MDEVRQILEIPYCVTKRLLQHFSWDKELLIERYYDDHESLFQKLGISTQNASLPLAAADEDSSVTKQQKLLKQSIVCNICYIDYTENQVFALSCSHFFCTNCWVSCLCLC